MKSPKPYVWKWRSALLILVAWVGLDGLAAITTAEVRPPRRKRRVMISPDTMQKKDKTAVDIGKSLVEIAQRASRLSTNQMVDLALVIDGSMAMKGPARMVEGRVADMASAFEESMIDYQLALVWFQNVNDTSQITVKPLQRGLSELEENFRKLPRKFNGRVAGYGLDAVMQGLEELKFRSGAEKHLVVVTNSALKTSWEMDSGRTQVISKILDRCKGDEIRINVIGIGEEIQIQLADQTDGKWYGIDKYQRKVERVPLIDKSVLKIDGIFRRISQHIATTVQQPTDIVFVFDSSRSMNDNVDEISTGLDIMAQTFDSDGLDYRFGMIRFWARSGGGESSVVTTKPPLNTNQVRKLFRTPKNGDEHLLDAIMEGVPRLTTPEERKLVLVIVTDESTSRRQEKGYTSARAVEVCRNAKAQVNVIGGVTPLGSGSFSDEFQRRVAEVTGGKHYIMPGSTIADERR